jgi:hypothetical protein
MYYGLRNAAKMQANQTAPTYTKNKTLSKWLVHKDGGVLALKTYGHLRDDHSREMAKKLKF